ncbi:hypothetical protein SLEP1_g36557 [Rubroshorea leprosula]|uniref:TF-B3 domain-containing protein n=1 Tax=Rubroshorea leprosula TaxID=152421 RepID=A0AAV5KRU3_9ROSI|nr:hypothetical protein SLEP1_g36557 [Rubroshorea leprosula]
MPLSTLVARKLLKQTDCRKRFAIPTKKLPLLPPFNTHFVSVDFWHGSKRWPMVISIRRNGYKKPVISKCWIPFVHENQLEVGDVVTIFRDEDEAGVWYRIEIERGSNPPRPTPIAAPTAHNSNFNVEVAANIPAIKQRTQLALGNVLPIARKAEELSLKPDDKNLGLTLHKGLQAPIFPFPEEVELKSTGGVQQQIAFETHHDYPKTANLNPILNQTSAEEFRLNLELTLAPPVVACEGNRAPTMVLFATEAKDCNPGIVLNLDFTLGPPKVN